ncbi:glycosyltransferase family 39 protein [Methylotenera sp.]|jgi:4-amino-4-deoxy-L-arabinose transferase-like glycosyltransferase|uniref:ArnT family glycosyltransferase n=1 Tax=Methylotenera sp. TaxID=2051956 RepID=UPI0027351F81|nr:glycosyltransferase family 39 protein [Methylotenera sp.]MDP3212012.1 glycosyltransferase family 39 protein [Methylotenera sp.]
MQQDKSNLYSALLIATILLGITVFLLGLGNIPFLSFNEARRAIPAANMIKDNDWLIPTLNGELYITKPPLLYWLSAGISQLFGIVNEWTARLTSALSAIATSMLVFVYARRHYGAWAALFALQIIIANAGFSMLGRQAGIEMLLSFLCFSSLICAFIYTHEEVGRKWLLFSYLLLGLAVLTKGPIALLFVTLPLLVCALYQRKARQWEVLRDPVGWLIFLLVGSSWYLAVTWQMGFDVWQSTVQKDMVTKIYSNTGEPIYNYVLWLAADFFPVFFLILISPITTWRRWKQHEVTSSLLIGLLVPFLIYTAFSDKHAKYLLPIYPIFAIVLGHKLSELYQEGGTRLKKAILGLLILMPIGYALFYTFAEAKVFHYRYEAIPLINKWFTEESSHLPIYGYKHLDERLIYYANRSIPIIDDTKLQSLKTSDSILLVEDSDTVRLKAEAQCTLKEFKPYLSRKGTLAILGFGAACESSSISQ